MFLFLRTVRVVHVLTNDSDGIPESDKINFARCTRSTAKRVACTFRAEEIIRNNTFHWHFQPTVRSVPYALTISYFLDNR